MPTWFFLFYQKINAYPCSFDFPLHAFLTAELNGEKSGSTLLVTWLSAGAASCDSQVGATDLSRVDINKGKCVHIVNCSVYHSVFNNQQMYTLKKKKKNPQTLNFIIEDSVTDTV